MYRYGTICLHAAVEAVCKLKKLYYNCTYNHLPEDEPSGTKYIEDIVKIKILV
jgi:hypothetical protein